ncbi:hypothetical protein NEIMUCOT_04120 [Neisseria mucosa ATCC 25996]|uniref:Uncharacterized protein n=1 Tax=Neisseria mucosa (strain ATCC 25996 / DSM 4631 / NCTC 10774 / M26) TaxID=546266 RepID=D2ZU32_NEIM2|nr:hypothetical protein NEIMUCOT_04120 [Neisseria mucosa ATCC 25996]
MNAFFPFRLGYTPFPPRRTGRAIKLRIERNQNHYLPAAFAFGTGIGRVFKKGRLKPDA